MSICLIFLLGFIGIVFVQASECEEAGYSCVAVSCAEGQEIVEDLGCCQTDGSYVCCRNTSLEGLGDGSAEECGVDEECVTPNFFQRIINWFRNLFRES